MIPNEHRSNRLRSPVQWHMCVAQQMPCLPHARHFWPENPAAVLMATHAEMA
jgi:hypothetical protein